MRSENMVGALDQQRTQVDVASLGDAELWVAVAGLAAFRTQAEITTHIATSLEALLAAQRQYVGQRRELSNAVDLEQRLGLVNVLGGDLAERKRASRPGIGEDDVEGSALGLHRRVESVEVGQIGDRALHCAGVGPEVGHSGVELCLPAPEDEDDGALLDEALCCGAANAGGATGDNGNLPLKLSHIYSLRNYVNIRYT